MDIRRWLTSTSKTSPKSVSNVDQNAGSNKESKNVSKSKKRRIIDSDDEEDPIPKKKNDSMKSDKQLKKSEKAPANSELEAKKAVSVSEFFGAGPIKREKTTKLQDKDNKNVKKNSIHEDSDFEATLNQLDAFAKDAKPEAKIKLKKEESEKIKGKSDKPKKRSSKTSESLQVEVIKNPEKINAKAVEKASPVVKKPKGSANYASYLNREGPRALGSKEIPDGEDDCLAGLTFIITGVLESMERDETKSLIEKYGGKVMTTLSKNTKYMIVGRDAGSSKLDKAEKLGTKQLDEDGLLDLIRTLPGKGGTSKKKSPKIEKKHTNSVSKEDSLDIEFMEEDDSFLEAVSTNEIEATDDAKSKSSQDIAPLDEELTVKAPLDKELVVEAPLDKELVVEEKPKKEFVRKTEGVPFMWVDKYKPTSLKQIIGQQGEKSNAKKLLHWLVNWHKSRRLNKKPMPNARWNAQDDGSGYKAALLSGPPGVGKTTSAVLVCKEAGFDYFEMNASDTRSKKYLQQSVSQLLGNQTLSDCFKDSSSGKVSNNHVIVMDEVDGMAGNEDRGGMKELIDFIKASKVPIICICNDRNHPKIRSLSNYCFDLRFQKPRVEQIKASMLSIAFKESIKVSPNALQDVIVAANQDIRQVLHNLSMWSAKAKDLSPEQTKHDIGKGTKHIKMGPFDVLRDVFAIGNNPKATIMDKSDLFFHDYSIAPLFVQENYLYVIPKAAEGDKKKHLTLLSQAADSICIGDIVDRQIRNQNSWSLLPTQAIFASVVPGELLCGNLRQMINFPAWLGKNSTCNHMDRVLQELHVHMRMKITGNKTDVNMEYLPLLKRALTKPLIECEQSGIPDVLKSMEYYHLLREDFDSIIDLSLWPNQIDPRSKINTKVKSAFTRAYNKESGKNPYAVTNIKKKKGSAANLDEEEELHESEEEEDDKVENDAMIKVKKPPKKNAPTQNETSTSKEKKKNPPKKGKTK